MSFRLSLIAALILGLAATASAEKQEFEPSAPAPTFDTGYIEVPPDQVAESHSSNIIFLNRCKGGCTMYPSQQEDSRQNQSSIINSTVNISEFAGDDQAWDALVSCVRGMYEPFNIEIVDQDPGNVSHFEAIVAGQPSDAGFPNQVGGVAPFGCGIINNAITYSFSNLYIEQGGTGSNVIQAVCEVVSQETAHAFGLDHEYYCPDNMTYLYGCGAKSFTDHDAECGENEARQCQCGGYTQNSYQSILNHFGESTPTPPTVSITQPEDGATVTPEFVIRVDAQDDIAVERAELYVNGSMTKSLTTEPFVFNAPADAPKGSLDIEVRVYDNRDTSASDSITVNLGDPCQNNGDCDEGDACVDGRCVPGDVDGGLGDTCEADSDCISGMCGSDGVDKYCVELCVPGNDGCPEGYSCLGAGDGDGVCWPGADGGGGGGGGCAGCQSGGLGSAAPLALFGFLGLALMFRRRRG